MSDLNQQIEDLLKEIKILKENQKLMTEKMEKMQQSIEHIESDIYIEELEWSEDSCEDEGCSGHCHECSCCEDSE